MEEVDEYLLNNGYSEELVDGLGNETKLHLYQQKAKFVNETKIPSESQEASRLSARSNWTGFSHDIIVSDISTGNDSKFIITYQFIWQVEASPNDDCFMILWDSNFLGLTETAVYEVYGPGMLVDSYGPPPVPIPTSCERQTFMHLTGDAAISEYSIRTGIGKKLELDYSSTVTKYYVSGAWGKYSLNPHDFVGNFSITIADPQSSSNLSVAVGSFFHWVKEINVDYEFVFSFPPALSIKFVDDSHYEKSDDTSYTFNLN